MSSIVSDINASLNSVREKWGWFLFLGILLVALGVAAIYYQSASTQIAVIALGVIMMAAGVLQLALVFQASGAGHVILYLLLGALDLVVGFLLITHPDVGSLAVTLVLSAYFLVGGIYRVVYSLWLQFPQWGWVMLSGLIMAALGVILFMQWEYAASWFPGFAVGVNFIVIGVTWVAIAMRLKSAVSALSA